MRSLGLQVGQPGEPARKAPVALTCPQICPRRVSDVEPSRCANGLPLMWKAYAPSQRESQPSRAASTSPASGASGTAVITLTTMPSAKPNTAPSPMAAPTPIWASRCSAHQRGDAPSQLRTWCPWHSTRGPGYPPRVAARRSLADLLDGELHARSRTNADTQRSSPRRSRRTRRDSPAGLPARSRIRR